MIACFTGLYKDVKNLFENESVSYVMVRIWGNEEIM
jgi:hypothetical protein